MRSGLLNGPVCGALVIGTGVILAAMGVAAAGAAPDAVAFASISSTGSVVSFGGTKTKTATATRLGAGDYKVTFTGSYGAATTATTIIPLSTAESSQSAVSNVEVDSASKTTLVIEVFTFDPSTEDQEDNNCFVTVFDSK